MRRAAPIALSVLLMIVATVGCTDPQPTGTAGDNQDTDGIISTKGSDGDVRITNDRKQGNKVFMNGMTIYYPKTFVSNGMGIKENNIQLRFKTHKFEIQDGVLNFDGNKFGSVKTGDEIEILKDGSIVVNSSPREPSP